MPRKSAEPSAIQVNAVYTPEDRPRSICPVCFSRPSVEGRYKKQTEDSKRRDWNPFRGEKRLGRTVYPAHVFQYPCSNEECNTYIRVYTSFSGLKEDEPWKTADKLTGEAAELFHTGRHDKNGVWRSTLAVVPQDMRQLSNPTAKPTPAAAARGAEPPVPASQGGGRQRASTPTRDPNKVSESPVTTGPAHEIESEGPWMYITCPLLAASYPSGWTLDKKGRLKVRTGTARALQIQKFFASRGIPLDLVTKTRREQ